MKVLKDNIVGDTVVGRWSNDTESGDLTAKDGARHSIWSEHHGVFIALPFVDTFEKIHGVEVELF